MKTKTERQIQNKKNRASGKAFELKIRADLEKKGWIVFRNGNDVEEAKPKSSFEWEGGCVFKQAKMKWNFFTKRLMMTHSGFPDFICIKMFDSYKIHSTGEEGFSWEVQFVECKVNGYLKPEEMEKVRWILEQLKIPIFVASKGIKRGEIKYLEMHNDKKI